MLAAVCTQFIRVYDLSTDAAAPVHTFYLPATAEDASGDGVGSCIRDVELVPSGQAPAPAPTASSPALSLSGEAAVEGSGEATSSLPPRLMATAVVLTGAGRLYSKGLLAPRKSVAAADGGDDDGAGAAGYAHDGEIRHRIAIPPGLEEEEEEPAVGAGLPSGGSAGGELHVQVFDWRPQV